MTLYLLTVPCIVCNLDFKSNRRLPYPCYPNSTNYQPYSDKCLLSRHQTPYLLPFYKNSFGVRGCSVGLTATAVKAPSCTAPSFKSSASIRRIIIPILHSLCHHARISITSLTSTTSASDFRNVCLYPIRILITSNG